MRVPAATDTRKRFEDALEALLAQVRQDPYILAAVLCGSMAHDVVWDRSDIDLFLVTQEVRRKAGGLSLTEHGVNIHAVLIPRGEFRRMLEGTTQSTFMHSLLSKGRMLHCRDEALAAMFEDARGRLGARDREIALLRAAEGVFAGLAKAQKWYHTRGDMRYAFFWIMKIVDGLASIELLLRGEVTEREVVQRALRHNPEFFGAIYSGLIDGPKTPETVGEALRRIEAYLRERTDALFRPVLEHLEAAQGIRSTTELNDHFQREMGLQGGLDGVYEWLADIGVIAKVGVPVRLTEKSRVDVQEAAYHYARD